MEQAIIANADLLRHLAATGPVESGAALARQLERDKGNVNKSLQLLEGLAVLRREPKIELTETGRRTLLALDLAEGKVAMDSAAQLVEWDRIDPDPENPRKTFDGMELNALAASIEKRGLLQPLVVRPAETAARFILTAGERRWRAIGRLIEDGLWSGPIPVRVRAAEDSAALDAAVENLQRAGLPPLEEAEQFKRLQDRFGMGTAEIADEIGKTQRFVQMRLQLLALPAEAKVALAAGMITVEQARALVQTPKPAAETAVRDTRPAPSTPDFAAGEHLIEQVAPEEETAHLLPPTPEEIAAMNAAQQADRLRAANEWQVRNLSKLVLDRMAQDRASQSHERPQPKPIDVAHALLDRARAGDYVGAAVCAAVLAGFGEGAGAGLALGRAGHGRILPADPAARLADQAWGPRASMAAENLTAAVAVLLATQDEQKTGFVSVAPVADEVMPRLRAAYAAAVQPAHADQSEA